MLLDLFQVTSRVRANLLKKSKPLSVSPQRVWLEGSRAARGDPDVTAPVPLGAVQRCSLPAAPMLWRQQNQS